MWFSYSENRDRSFYLYRQDFLFHISSFNYNTYFCFILAALTKCVQLLFFAKITDCYTAINPYWLL